MLSNDGRFGKMWSARISLPWMERRSTRKPSGYASKRLWKYHNGDGTLCPDW